MKIVKVLGLLSEKNIGSGIKPSTYLVEIEGEKNGVWRPNYSNSIGVKNEVASYEVAKIVSYEGIPETQLYCYEGQDGSLRKFEEGKIWKDGNFGDIDVDLVSMQQLAVFDFLTLNSDRGINNIVIKENGQCIGIDNEVAFSVLDGVSFNISYCIGVSFFPEAKELISKILKNKNNILGKLTEIEIPEKNRFMVERRIVALSAIIGIDDVIIRRFGIP